MNRIHCDGCGITEDAKTPKPKIKRVKLLIETDPRFPEGTSKYDADLCPDCQGVMLHKFFKTPAEGKLEVPAFLAPVNDKERMHETAV
jgi:hypothetical protein